MSTSVSMLPSFLGVIKASENIRDIVNHTPLIKNKNLSETWQAQIWLKREDLQVVRSYKIRGAYNKMCMLSGSELKNGVVCASAGNHAQGVAFSCHKLRIKGSIFMPSTTPRQKIRQVETFGRKYVDIILTGDLFDDCSNDAITYCKTNNSTFIHPFDDPEIIEGQGTVALEILEDINQPVDYLFVPVGGGGLASGIITVFRELSPETKIVGVEPEGAPSMKTTIHGGSVTTLKKIDSFIDGAAVKRVGEITFEICKDYLDDMITVPEGLVCSNMLLLYNNDAIVAEPAGALSLAALPLYEKEIKGKNVICIVSGSNNDISRLEEIKERALLYEGLKHYFIIRFPQRAGALKQFVVDILGPDDDITHFEYFKKHNREQGPAVVGIELKSRKDFAPLMDRIRKNGFMGEYLNEKSDLFQFLIG